MDDVIPGENLTEPTPRFLTGGGKIGALMRAHDWTKTPLGAPSGWPQSLRTAVSIMLSSRYAMWMAWGPELTFFCNDAYRPTLGVKQGWLGARSDKVWEEIWSDIVPRIEHVFSSGEATWDEALLLFLERSGFTEETYHTFSYSPLAADDGVISGMLCVVTEETERVIGERRLKVLRDLATALAGIRTIEELCIAVSACAGETSRDLPFCLTYLSPSEAEPPALALAMGVNAEDVSAASWPLDEVLHAHTAQMVGDLGGRFRSRVPSGPWDRAVSTALAVPIAAQGQDRPIGVAVLGLNPYRPLDAEYRGFIDLFVGQIAAALANARAYDAERRRSEALAEIDRAKTAFFSNVSHEFRTPLTLMLGPLEDSLAEAESLPPALRGRLQLAHRNSLRLLRLVNGLLDFSRIEAGRPQVAFRPTDIAALTIDLASSFRAATERAGLELRVDCPPLAQPIYLDRDMWEKIVLNLLSNAFKFTFTGEIAVEIREVDRQARLTVRDTGIGIAPQELPKLFERFHRIEGAKSRSFEGSGIGLALVQELVKLHGGSISVHSEVGLGTAFEIDLPFGVTHLPVPPVEKERSAAAPSALAYSFVEEALRWIPDADLGDRAGSADPAVTRVRIVVADDNGDLRNYITHLLGQNGYDVQAVADGEQALSAVRESRPALLITDVMMPKLDGFGLLRAVREDTALRDLPVIMLSARAGEEAKVEGLDAGADDYLTKPFSAREFLARVGATLALARVRREAAQALQLEQARAASVLEGMGEAYLLIDQEFRILQVNAEGLRRQGRSAAEILGKTCWEIWPKTLAPGVRERIEQSMRDREIGTIEFQAPSRMGIAKWTESRIYPTTDGLAIFARDVTDRKRADEALRQMNQSLEVLIQERTVERDRLWRNSRDLLVVLDAQGIFRAVNPAWTSVLGWAQEELIGHSYLEFLHPDDHPAMPGALLVKQEALSSYENRYRHKDGGIRWMSWVATVEDNLIYSTGRHITAERIARQALARSEAQLRTIFETSFQYQGLISLDGTLLDTNSTSLEGIRAAAADVIGKPYWDAPWFSGTPGMSELVRETIAAVAKGAVFRNEVEGHLPIGRRWFDFAMRPMRNDQNEIVAILAEAVDITERRRAEEQLRQSQKIEAIGQLTGGVAHDFNNLLTVIMGGLDLLDRQPSPERRLRVLGGMRQAVERGAGLSRQLLTFSRRQSLRPEPVDLARQIGGMRELLDRSLRGDIQIEMIFAPDLWPVEIDAGELELMLLNLAVNARDAMPNGGMITIAASNAPDFADDGLAGDFVRLAVRDTGTGMPPEVIAHMFEPFFTTKEIGKGSGLGLAQTHGFIRASGGTIQVESRMGEGTAITLFLPRTDKVPVIAAPSAVSSDAVESGAALHVLLVEDDDEVAALTTDMLSQLGYEVVRVGGAEAALGALADGRNIDVVFSDIMMPGAMNGVGLARELRRRRPDLPVLLTSGYAEATKRDAEIDHVNILAKPYRLEDLQTALAAARRGAGPKG